MEKSEQALDHVDSLLKRWLESIWDSWESLIKFEMTFRPENIPEKNMKQKSQPLGRFIGFTQYERSTDERHH